MLSNHYLHQCCMFGDSKIPSDINVATMTDEPSSYLMLVLFTLSVVDVSSRSLVTTIDLYNHIYLHQLLLHWFSLSA